MSSINYFPQEQPGLKLALSPELEALLARAARIKNATLNDFALSALEEAAQSALETDQVIELSARDYPRFLAALDEDAEPTEAMRRAWESHRELIQP